MTTTVHLITAEQLLAMPDVGRCELIQGGIVQMAPASDEHGEVAAEISRRIGNHVVEHRLGRVYIAEAGFVIERDPDTVRVPDVAFLRRDRVPRPRRGKYIDGPPDLAVEVVSPGDSIKAVRAKARQWLAAGAVSVWIVDPKRQLIEVHRQDPDVLIYHLTDELADEPTLPGFVLKVADVFAE